MISFRSFGAKVWRSRENLLMVKQEFCLVHLNSIRANVRLFQCSVFQDSSKWIRYGAPAFSFAVVCRHLRFSFLSTIFPFFCVCVCVRFPPAFFPLFCLFCSVRMQMLSTCLDYVFCPLLDFFTSRNISHLPRK